MDKALFINKPIGMTSFDVVKRCRNLFHEKRIGHTGTLDPNASGLLIVLMGKYTKYLPYCVHHHKAYHATFKLGELTDTEDIWGKVIDTKEPRQHSQAELDQLASSMLGHYSQIPPMYSSIKVKGRKLYEYARNNQVIERKPRDCYIDLLEIKKITEEEYSLDVIVSSGTYIRTLITDIGKKMDELATMTSLVRTGIEDIKLEDAYTLEQIESGDFQEVDIKRILDRNIPLVEIDNPEDIYNGKSIYLQNDEELVILLYNGNVLAAYEKGEDNYYHSKRGLF